MRIHQEPNVDLLRKKAAVLESENERLSQRVGQLLSENLRLKGMSAAQVAINLPGLLEQIAGQSRPGLTRPGSERRNLDTGKEGSSGERPAQKGHGPTPQPKLEMVQETFDLDDADKKCVLCGKPLEPWVGQEDEIEVVEMVERKWLVKQCTLKKYRCTCGGCVTTADGPDRLIKGGRYAPSVAISSATGKFLDHIPLDRQVRIAKRQGVKLTTQTLCDQLMALEKRVASVIAERLKALFLTQPVIGVDESPFKLIKKGGSVKWQAWQISCPLGIYFEIHDTKSAEVGKKLLGEFAGTVMADGAKAYESLARAGPFVLANCWSHARRNVLEAEVEAPGQVKEFLDMVGEMYAIEEKAAVGPPDELFRGYRYRVDEERLRVLRDTETRPAVKRIQEWILAQKCLPGGLLKARLEYVAKRWTSLTRFLDDPKIPLDNNRTEAGYVNMAIGRRNYLGARSIRGTKVAASFYTVFETAKLVGVDPEAYLRYATAAVLAGESPLLPHEWKQKIP